MAKLLKDELDKRYLERLSSDLYKSVNQATKDRFITYINDNNYFENELKDRIRIVSNGFFNSINLPFKDQLEVLDQFAHDYQGLSGFVFPEFIGLHGLATPLPSYTFIEKWTRYSTAEFAIRPFIQKHYKKTIEQMTQWSSNENEHVRRLSSEGLRPYLPWTEKLEEIITDTSPNFKIIKKLQYDKSNYVRKSIANHINDLSKIDPNQVVAWANNKRLNRSMVKHGLRTLLKKNDKQVLNLLGFKNPEKIELDIAVSLEQLKIPGKIKLKVQLKNNSKMSQRLRLDYIVSFVKKNGSHSPKKFFLKELTLKSNTQVSIDKEMMFKNLSTRKLYPGLHKVKVDVNGTSFPGVSFKLI